MTKLSGFSIDNANIRFKKDQYSLSKINAARVKSNTFKDHALKVVTVGLIASSVVWMICPDGFGILTGPFSIVIGALAALTTIRKYELQVEFRHADETGLQWITIAKTNKPAIKKQFEHHVNEIREKLA
ncbi:hypothetical protein [Vibrio paucivorans]